MVVGYGTLATIEWSLAFFVVRVAPFVPVATDALVTVILHHEHRLAGTFVDIQHFTAIFGHLRVQHVTATDGASAVWVVLVAYLFHLSHILLRNLVVATLIEDDAGIVAVVDDGVTHYLGAL